MPQLYTHRYDSPVGALHLAVDQAGLVHRVSYEDITGELEPGSWETNKYACGELELQLDEYFAGHRVHFSVAVSIDGTSFQKAVWNRMRKINYGSTMSYSTLAQKIGRKDAAQAVGNATGANPLVIVVPCHRIVSASGSLGAYAKRSLPDARGREVKKYLLQLEGAV